jgi:hypothetical protein
MLINDFIEEKELRIISFSIFLVKEIERKIQNKLLHNKEQINRYIEKQVEFFLKSLSAQKSLKNVYKYQILSNVHFKLNYLLKSGVLLSNI